MHHHHALGVSIYEYVVDTCIWWRRLTCMHVKHSMGINYMEGRISNQPNLCLFAAMHGSVRHIVSKPADSVSYRFAYIGILISSLPHRRPMINISERAHVCFWILKKKWNSLSSAHKHTQIATTTKWRRNYEKLRRYLRMHFPFMPQTTTTTTTTSESTALCEI